jgi:hypothetical protein
VILLPFWVSLVRGVLQVGCSPECWDGNNYLVLAGPPAMVAVAASVVLVVLHIGFASHPTLTRWRVVAGMALAVPAVLAIVVIRSGVAADVVAPLALLGGGALLVLLAVAVGRSRRLSMAFCVAGAAAFAAAVLFEYQVLAVAALGLVIAVVAAVDRAVVP